MSKNAFVPLDSAARWARGLLFAGLFLSVVSIVFGLMEEELLARVATGAMVSQAELATNDVRQRFVGVAQIVCLLGTAIAFLIWIYRAHRNLRALGAQDVKYKSKWAVWGFFVPFLNLVRPFQVMREIWHGSDPVALRRDEVPEDGAREGSWRAPPLVVSWWASYLLSQFVSQMVFRMVLLPNDNVGDMQAATLWSVGSDVIDILSAVFALNLIAQITKWQSERSLLIGTGTLAGAIFPEFEDRPAAIE